MSIKVSLPIADIYDKLTILDIKKEKIKDERVNEIIKEIDILKNDTKDLVINEESCSYKYYELLKQIL